MSFKTHLIVKMQGLVGVYYQLYRNGVNYLKILWIGWTFLNFNADEIYDMITSILELILLIVSSCKYANLPRL